ncbi:MAG: ankyrin repeat domain-containing protein [Coxiellaceae bacterium]|nr:MAG: ankyrin repeat domain-containing protein [Coxiellaceae bacterium]
MLENGAKLDAKSLSGETTFNTAIAAGHTKLFMMLIDESNRTALETADLEGKTPLLAAAAAGNLDAIKHVVKQNVNMAAVSSQKKLPYI